MPHPNPTWLNPIRSKKRTLKDIHRFVSPENILNIIQEAEAWPYKRNKEFYLKRDKALLALLYLSGGRVNEVLKVHKTQFSFEDPEAIEIKDFVVSKRKAKTISREGLVRIDIALNLVGSLKPFTEIVLDYYKISQPRLFFIGRSRAWQIVKYGTGKWCHYFRSQRISEIINRIRSSDATARIVGIKNPQTISHYYKGTWREFKKELLK